MRLTTFGVRLSSRRSLVATSGALLVASLLGCSADADAPGAGDASVDATAAQDGRAGNDRDGGRSDGSAQDAESAEDASAPDASSSGVSVVTNRYDNTRSGSNMHEPTLDTSNVNGTRFGLLYSRTVDGQQYAQPLYLSNLTFADGSTRNVVFASTMHNTVYAFDVAGTDDKPIWSKSLGASGPVNGFGCTDMVGEVGITATPVIDAEAGILYVLAKGRENGTWIQRLHALDVRTGEERAGSPVVIAASVPGAAAEAVGGKVSFNPELQLGRSGLLLDQGTVYIAFASHCDKGAYHGWILAYAYANGAFAQTKAFNLSPNGRAGGIWQAGVGLSSDADGIYSAAGNGSTNPTSTPVDLSESVVRLSRGDLAVQDYWTPKDYKGLNGADADLSTGAILLPYDRVLTGSKDGRLYVLDRKNLGKYSAAGDQILQTFTTPGKANGERGHLHGGPIYYRVPGSGDEWVYLWPEEGPLIGYKIDPSTHLLQKAATASNVYTPGHPGGILALSANGTAGSGVLWASIPQQDAWHSTEKGTLYAVDAADITRVLWSSEENAARDAVGNFAKFTPPTVADGHVFLATFSNALRVYGLLN